MKNVFEWYLNPSEQELKSIWDSGILTVDTNVLLDLYRYHDNTRNSLIESLKNFKGEKWLSHQAATEFFRNRTKVIVSSEKSFTLAKNDTEKLRSSLDHAVSQLKGNRIIPSGLADELDSQVKKTIQEIESQIDEIKNQHPNFLKEDPILDKLLAIFDGAIGEDFTSQEKEAAEQEANRRKNNKIPPGYLDVEKDADRPYGDYFLWRQVLKQAKDKGKPIILVTSERKEDWWERQSGKTIGPRTELLKEAKQASGQRVLIYQTEKFLEHALKHFKKPVNESAIEEIRAVSTWRSESEPAVRLIDQSSSEATLLKNTGTLMVELKRPVRNFTVSGHLEPKMESIPSLTIKLTKNPESLSSVRYKLTGGTGTTHDFNVHLSSTESQVMIPIGTYEFEYEATIETDAQVDF